jgi:hypothetical protein
MSVRAKIKAGVAEVFSPTAVVLLWAFAVLGVICLLAWLG